MRTPLRGFDLYYRDEGAGPTVVLLHAFPLSGAMWEPQIPALRGIARLLLPDLRGFGQSGGGTGNYTLDVMAEDVLTWLDSLEVGQFVLGGLSMGGYLSFALLRHIDRSRVRGLILADTRSGADSDEGRQNRLIMARQAETEGSGPIADAMVGKLLGKTSLESCPTLVERVKRIIRANTGAGIAGAQRAMAARPDSTALLSELTMPALVLVGEEDALTPPSEAESIARLLPNARKVVLSQAGHLSNWEAPDAFNASVEEFLESLDD